jgi:hypothetical protein
MTFFSEVRNDKHIDEKIDMSKKEFEMMVLGMIEDSNAWERHKAKHHDAKIVPAFKEDMSGFEEKVEKHSKKSEEQSVVQYNNQIKMNTAQCNCGAKFEIDVKNDKVEEINPNLKMKEFNNYGRNNEDNSKNSEYGRSENNSDNPSYNNGPKRQSNPSYSSNSESGLKYKN